MHIRQKIWIEKDGKVIFGQGRDELLKALEECHSLQGAAKKLHMSYRAAWGKLKASEKRLGIRLVESEPGKPMQLTEKAKMLINLFEEIEQEVSAILMEKEDRVRKLTK
jgi:molybdate transport system regulatory protein